MTYCALENSRAIYIRYVLLEKQGMNDINSLTSDEAAFILEYMNKDLVNIRSVHKWINGLKVIFKDKK